MANKTPNWKDIERCPIWKVLGIIECNSCDTNEMCWGTDINLDKVLENDRKEFGNEKPAKT